MTTPPPTPTFVWTRGLPGSGKTTYARNWVAQNPTRRARVNQDDLRAMLHNSAYHGAATQTVVKLARRSLVRRLLLNGQDVICDDCNLSPDDAEWVDSLNLYIHNLNITCVDMRDVPLDVCLLRNHAREGHARIPENDIRAMHTRYIQPTQKQVPT